MPDKRTGSLREYADAVAEPQDAPSTSESVEPAKPRLLFLSQTLPYPPNTGVTIRTFNVLRELAKRFDISALCFYRRAAKPDAADVTRAVEALAAYARIEAFPIPQEHSKTRLLWDHSASIVTGRPYTVFAYRSSAYAARVRDLLESCVFDLVHVDSLDLSTYLPYVRDLPVVCVHHNVESQLLRRRSGAERVLVRRAYVLLQAHLTKREERKWCGQVALNITVSDADRHVLASVAPGARIMVVPNGVDTSLLKPADVTNVVAGRLVFVGGYGWFPNADALEYFCTEILPLIRRREPDVEVRWVGRAPPEVVSDVSAKFGIAVTGFVADMRDEVHPASCYVVPLRVGGGTRLKILDAWALGKAVVSTSIGCEGLDARHGQNILIADTPAEFAEAVHRVLSDPGLRIRLGENARVTAVEQYDWQVIGQRMLPVYEELSRNRTPCAK